MEKIKFPPSLYTYNDPVRGFVSDELLYISKSETRFKKKLPEYTDRPHGRDDWQIIYLSNGCGYYQFGNEVMKLGPCVLLVFKPFEPQQYAYYGEDCPVINFVHFCGTAAGELLKRFGLDDKPYYYLRPTSDQSVVNLFLKLQLQLRLHPNDNHLCWGVFLELLALMCNSRVDNERTLDLENVGKYTDEIAEILREIHNNPAARCQVKDYADRLHLSASRFAHIFKSLTGSAPIEYRNNLRIDNAKNILLNSTASIEEIAFSLGYDNLANFSKAFKNKTGCSPTQYRSIQSIKTK